MPGKKRSVPIVPPPAKVACIRPPVSKSEIKASPVRTKPEAKQAPAPAGPEVEDPSEQIAEARPSPPRTEELIAAQERCSDPFPLGHTMGTSAPKQCGFEPLSVELARAEGVRRLRLCLGEHVRKLHTKLPVVGAFERWHFGWLREAARRAEVHDPLIDPLIDPLLPAVPAPEADAALMQELVCAGADEQEAARITVELRQGAMAEAAKLRSAAPKMVGESHQADKIGIQAAPDNSTSRSSAASSRRCGLSLVSVVVSVAGSEGAPGKIAPLKISDEQLAKLRAMHAQASSAAPGAVVSGDPALEESRFHIDLVRMLLRYKTIGGSGFQAALGGAAFAVLRRCFGCTAEAFASPLNARTAPFCSAFPDVDGAFGSVGSFLDLRPTEGSFEANPPFAPELILAMAAHMQALLESAEASAKPLLFAVFVGASAALRRHEAWAALQRLAGGTFGRAQWLVALHTHGYTEGHAHIMRGGARETCRMSSCDTAVFILATSAAAAQWPASAAAESALRDAMRAAVPRKIKQRASKANKEAHAAKRKKRGKGARG